MNGSRERQRGPLREEDSVACTQCGDVGGCFELECSCACHSVSKDARDIIRELHALLREAESRLDHYTLGCPCPGVSCVESCRECNATQALVNRIHAVTSAST